MNPHIENALASLRRANYAGYFGEMDKLIIPNEYQVLYATQKNTYISGQQVPFDFSQKLEVLAKQIDRNLDNNPPTQMKEDKQNTSTSISSSKNVVSGNTIGDIGGNFHIGDVVHNQDAEIAKQLQLANELKKQELNMAVAPELWLNGAGYHGSTGEMHIDLNNKGETAYLKAIELLSGDMVLDLHSLHIPYTLEKGARRKIMGRATAGKHPSDCEYEIQVLYQDKLKNNFKLIITGKGQYAKITYNEML